MIGISVQPGRNSMGKPSATSDISEENTGNMTANESHLTVKEGVVPIDLLDEISIFFETLIDAVTSGKKRLMGKTFLDPKKDSKWERGRTRRVMHFGAHVRGGKAVGAEVEEVPECLLKVKRVLQATGCLQHPSNRRAAVTVEGALNDKDDPSCYSARVLAVTVDFFRKGTYTPALAATAPVFNPYCHNPPLDPSTTMSFASKAVAALEAERPLSAERDGSTNTTTAKNQTRPGEYVANNPYTSPDGSPDTEPEVYMLWLQDGGEVIVGSAPELAQGGKAAISRATGLENSTHPAEREGSFLCMERLAMPKGSVMLWDGMRAKGDQVAVPASASMDRVLVSFQTLTPEASLHVLRNRAEREATRARTARVRRAAQEARHLKDKGVTIPGTPINVEEWRPATGEEDLCEGNSVFHNNVRKADAEVGGGDDEKTPPLEREHVQAVYDTIAPHWSHTRYKPWPKVAEFLSRLEACSLVADAGCGNGKYLGCDVAGGFLLGSDASLNLLHVCKERLPQAEVFASDCMRLPFRSGVFDAAISIAVLHHFSSEARRLRALSELCRIIRPGGVVLVYAWAIEQDEDSRRSFAAQDVLVPWHLGDHHAQDKNITDGRVRDSDRDRDRDMDRDNRTEEAQWRTTSGLSLGGEGSSVGSGQYQYPDPIINNNVNICDVEQTGLSGSGDDHLAKGSRQWSSPEEGGKAVAPAPRAPRHGVRREAVPGSEGSVVYQRYCHVYVEGELEGLVEKVDGLRLLESYYDRSNWCVVAEREMDHALGSNL